MREKGRGMDMIRMVLQGHCIFCNQDMLRIDGKELPLTHMERELLCYLLHHPNCTLSREQLLKDVWGYEFPGNSRTVDAHIKTLRQHLKEYEIAIITVRGVGYQFKAEQLCCKETDDCCCAC